MATELTSELIERVRRERSKIFQEYMNQHRVEPPKPNGDITMVQLEDMDTKIKSLEDDVNLLKGPLQSTDPNYKRLSEAIVNYSIKLDRINVIGRPGEKSRRKEMLVELDRISTLLIQKLGTNSSSQTKPKTSSH